MLRNVSHDWCPVLSPACREREEKVKDIKTNVRDVILVSQRARGRCVHMAGVYNKRGVNSSEMHKVD